MFRFIEFLVAGYVLWNNENLALLTFYSSVRGRFVAYSLSRHCAVFLRSCQPRSQFKPETCSHAHRPRRADLQVLRCARYTEQI